MGEELVLRNAFAVYTLERWLSVKYSAYSVDLGVWECGIYIYNFCEGVLTPCFHEDSVQYAYGCKYGDFLYLLLEQ